MHGLWPLSLFELIGIRLRDEVVFTKSLTELRSTDRLLQKLFHALFVAKLGKALQLVARTHEDDRRFKFFALLFRSTLLVFHDHQLQKGLYLLDHFDSCHFWHLELSNQEVNSASTLLLKCVLHDEVNSCQTACKELNLSLASKVD